MHNHEYYNSEYQKDLDRGSFLQRLLYLPFHFIAGINSNIPLCCVLYWCYIWIFYNIPKENSLFKVTRETVKEYNLPYFPCPKCCKKKHFAQIKWDGKDDWDYYNEFQDLYTKNPNILNDFI